MTEMLKRFSAWFRRLLSRRFPSFFLQVTRRDIAEARAALGEPTDAEMDAAKQAVLKARASASSKRERE